MIDGDIRIYMTVGTYQKYQEKVEADANMLCQLKQRDHINKLHDKMAVLDAEEVSHVSSYPLIQFMGFDTYIYDGIKKRGQPFFWERLSVSINTLKIV